MASQRLMGQLVAVVVIGASAVAVLALTQDCPELLGSSDTPGAAMGVAVAGGCAYVADGVAGGLRVVDEGTPPMPIEVGFVDTPVQARGIAVSGSYVYVADTDSGLRVVDVSTPSAPVEVGFFNTPGAAQDVTVAGGCLYTAGSDAGLAVFRDCFVFSDDFESGDTSAWSATVP